MGGKSRPNWGINMKPLCFIAAVLWGLAVAAPAPADDKKTEEAGFVPMFDGKSLKGWVNVNCAPSTFFVKDNQIITTGKPTGYLRTEKQYENFIAEFDWMHIPPKPGEVGNSGFFVWADPIPAVGTGYTRGIEVQVLVNLTYKNKKGEITATSQGDLFSIWGATCVPERPHPDGWARCLPSENHCKGENEWNHYRVEANDGVIKLAVNGHFVSSVSKCKPRKGYLALESEGSECRFKNLKIKELPSTNPKKDEVADVAQGHKSLYTGLDLSGWKADESAKKHWQPRDTVLHYDGKDEAKDNGLRTEKEYGPGEFILDFRFPPNATEGWTLRLQNNQKVKTTLKPGGVLTIVEPTGIHQTKVDNLKSLGQWNRLHFVWNDRTISVVINGKSTCVAKNVDLPAQGSLALVPDGPMDFANLFVRELK
jgi:hypothetical protein